MTGQPGDIPQVDDVLHRPRLFRLMQAPRSWRMVLVTGQAAQGKTTLVADFLATQETPSLWFHLNRAASDHGVLFDILARGLGRPDPDGGQASTPPHITLGSRKDLLRQIEILVMGLNQRAAPLTIVLDDLEALDPQGSAFEFIETLLEEAPDFVRFFLLSRTTPPINLSRFRMKKQLLALTNEDLAFNRDETRAFFRRSGTETVHALADRDVEKILTVTEGWAGGLVLVSESMRISQDLGQLPHRLSSEAFSYFSGEIYHTLTHEIRGFLMKSALFDDLDTKILASFFTDIDPCVVLAQLDRRNLFVRKIRAHSKWPVFKYNNLFKEFLHADLLERLEADEISELNRRAGQIYWDIRDHDKAVDFFMAAKAHAKIARIIRIKGTEDLINGRSERLLEWISALPEDMAREDPWLIFFATAARRIKGGNKNITAFHRALEMFKTRKDSRGILLCLAYIIEASVFIRQPSQAILKWISQGEAALAALQGKQRFTWARTLLWQQIGLGYITGNGDIPKGISACRNAILLARGIENQDQILNASVILTLGFVQSGDFAGARNMLEKIAGFTGENRYPEYRALKNITNIDFALKKGDTGLAGRLLSDTEADIEKFGLIFLYPGFVEAKAIYYAVTGQFDQAVQTADHLSDFSILEGNEFYLGISHRIKAMANLFQGWYEQALGEAELAVNELGRLMRGDIHLNLARQILGISQFHLGQWAEARKNLESVQAYFKGIGSDLSYCETAFVLGLLAPELGVSHDPYFRSGFEKAIENQYPNFPLLDNRTLGRAFVSALSSSAPSRELLSYFKAIKGESLSSVVRETLSTALGRCGKKQRAPLAEQLASLYKAAQPGLFIQTLGSFRVSIGGREIDPSRFGGVKPLLLLKALVLKGGQDIPKEILIDTLWPGAAASAGEKNFKINLHRLRKALEPTPIKDFGYLYISQKSGRVSLDPELVRTDTQVFMEWYTIGLKSDAQGKTSNALDAFSNAAAHYKGAYFGDDLYLEWVGHHREFYRHKCLEILGKKAGLHRDLDQWQEAVDTWQAALSLDSCHEAAFQNLMILYGEAGLKGDLLRLFDQCRFVLQKELDAEPGESTLEIFNRFNL